MKTFTRDFPHPSIHEGAMLGNGWLGLYVWGSGHTLIISPGCSNCWDHRGGMEWSTRQNYADIRKALENRDQDAITRMFATSTERMPGQPERPSLIPIGRIEIQLADDTELLFTEADYEHGVVRAVYSTSGQTSAAEIRLDMTDKGSFACRCGDIKSISVQSSYELSSSTLSGLSFGAPVRLDEGNTRGFIQFMPADGPFSLCTLRQGDILACRFSRPDGADPELRRRVMASCAVDWEQLAMSNAQWWSSIWQTVPEVTLGNKELENIYYENLAKFCMMTCSDGVPAGLQGPWIEDDTLPPWSGDYHFNINVQMCYWPGFRAGLSRNLRPLFDMLFRWKPIMRKNAMLFIGIENGYLLPHAVDDRCTCMGQFWPGTIDCGCGAWISQMMYEYYTYTGDLAFLRDDAFDFMQGVFNVFFAMLEWHDGRLCLPLTVSPEYGGNSLEAWGANASFQLAALHRLTRDLQAAAAVLGLEPDPHWEQVAAFLPKASLLPCGQNSHEIALWDNKTLEESHRHHSHLGGLCPFDTIDPDALEWKDIVRNSINRWTERGMGMWTGWCLPWASMITSRIGNGDMAELILDIWRKAFRNRGGGSTHDTTIGGLTIFQSRPHIMQMDGSMGALTAIQDMLLHSRQGTLHVFAGVPETWGEVSFRNMPAPGGFLITATRIHRGYFKVIATATRAGDIRMVVHDPRPLKAIAENTALSLVNGVFACHLEPGQSLQVFA